MAVSDYSGQAWYQGFNDVGETVFGMTADQLMEMKVRPGHARFIIGRTLMEAHRNVTRTSLLRLWSAPRTTLSTSLAERAKTRTT